MWGQGIQNQPESCALPISAFCLAWLLCALSEDQGDISGISHAEPILPLQGGAIQPGDLRSRLELCPALFTSVSLHVAKHRWDFTSEKDRTERSPPIALLILGFWNSEVKTAPPHSKWQAWGEKSIAFLSKGEMLTCLFLSFNFVYFIHLCTYFLMFFSSLLLPITYSHILVFYCYPASSLFPFLTTISLIINTFSFNNFLSPT
jgi:hypothetical protein